MIRRVQAGGELAEMRTMSRVVDIQQQRKAEATETQRTQRKSKITLFVDFVSPLCPSW